MEPLSDVTFKTSHLFDMLAKWLFISQEGVLYLEEDSL